MAFAADKAQAVLNNDFYSPLNIKLAVSYYDTNGTIKLARITSKDVLKKAGASKNTLLAFDYDDVDVFVITKTNKTITNVTDLTTAGNVTLNLSRTLHNNITGKDGHSYKYSETGVLEVDVYSSPLFDLVGETEVLDKGSSETNSAEWFEISGFYSYKETGSTLDKNGIQNISVKLDANALGGLGSDSTLGLDIPDPTALSGKASGSGSGKIVPVI
jgi:hypothetical protein